MTTFKERKLADLSNVFKNILTTEDSLDNFVPRTDLERGIIHSYVVSFSILSSALDEQAALLAEQKREFYQTSYDEGYRDGEIHFQAKVREVIDQPTKYPTDIFHEPWQGFEKEIDELAKSKGMRIDNITAYFGRWQEKLIKNEILQALNL